MAAETERKAPLIVALSSRTLFDLDESNRVFEEEGVEAYCQYQIAREDEPLEPGVAFPPCKSSPAERPASWSH